MRDIVVPCAAWRRNLECGDKSRAVRGSRHRFLSALCAETHLVATLSRSHLIPTLSRIHLAPTLSRLRQRRSVSTKCKRRSVGTKCRDERLLVRGQADACPSRRFASPDTAHRNLNRPFTERAGTPALPTAHTQNTRLTRMPPVTNRLPDSSFWSLTVRGEGRASARPRASRRLPLPAAVTPPPRKRSLRLRVSALKKLSTLNFQLSAVTTPSRKNLCASASLR